MASLPETQYLASAIFALFVAFVVWLHADNPAHARTRIAVLTYLRVFQAASLVIIFTPFLPYVAAARRRVLLAVDDYQYYTRALQGDGEDPWPHNFQRYAPASGWGTTETSGWGDNFSSCCPAPHDQRPCPTWSEGNKENIPPAGPKRRRRGRRGGRRHAAIPLPPTGIASAAAFDSKKGVMSRNVSFPDDEYAVGARDTVYVSAVGPRQDIYGHEITSASAQYCISCGFPGGPDLTFDAPYCSDCLSGPAGYRWPKHCIACAWFKDVSEREPLCRPCRYLSDLHHRPNVPQPAVIPLPPTPPLTPPGAPTPPSPSPSLRDSFEDYIDDAVVRYFRTSAARDE